MQKLMHSDLKACTVRPVNCGMVIHCKMADLSNTSSRDRSIKFNDKQKYYNYR